jgi:hypothetical protein
MKLIYQEVARYEFAAQGHKNAEIAEPGASAWNLEEIGSLTEMLGASLRFDVRRVATDGTGDHTIIVSEVAEQPRSTSYDGDCDPGNTDCRRSVGQVLGPTCVWVPYTALTRRYDPWHRIRGGG